MGGLKARGSFVGDDRKVRCSDINEKISEKLYALAIVVVSIVGTTVVTLPAIFR